MQRVSESLFRYELLSVLGSRLGGANSYGRYFEQMLAATSVTRLAYYVPDEAMSP